LLAEDDARFYPSAHPNPEPSAARKSARAIWTASAVCSETGWGSLRKAKMTSESQFLVAGSLTRLRPIRLPSAPACSSDGWGEWSRAFKRCRL